MTLVLKGRDERTLLANADAALLSEQDFPYRTRTDAAGTATWNVPKSRYELAIVLMDYKDFKTTVEVDGDVTVHAELIYDPDLGG